MKLNQIRPYAIAILLVISAGASADLKLALEESIVFGGAGEDAAASENREDYTLWMGKDRSARVSPGKRMVARLDLGETYIIDDANKTVHTIKMGKNPGDKRPIVEKSAETREIDGWQASRYNLTFAMTADTIINMTLWISDDIGVDLQDYHTFTRAMDTGNGLLSAIADLPGYPVLQETDLEIMQGQVKLIAVAEETAPAGIYAVPQDYQRK